MKKMIFIFERRHGYSYDYDMFGIKSFEEKGYEVEVWSAVRWTYGNLPDPKASDLSGRTRYIDNEQQYAQELKRIRNDECIFIIYPYHGYEYTSYIIRKKICQNGFEFCNITESPSIRNLKDQRKLTRSVWGILINEMKKNIPDVGRAIKSSIIALNVTQSEKKENIKTRWENIYARIMGPFLYKSKCNFITTELEYAVIPNQFEVLSGRNYLIHAWLYDECLKSEGRECEFKSKYVVYVDDFIVGHSDFIKSGEKMPIQNKELYFEQMKALFENIEKEYESTVIIAAHPKAEYRGDEFGNREIIYNNTHNLIKNAQLVLIEASTCWGLVAIYKKDFINIYSAEAFRNCPSLIEDYKMILEIWQCKQLNIENQTEVRNWKNYIKKYDQGIYEEYMEKFVLSKGGVADIDFWRYIANKICRKEIEKI